MSHPNIPSSGVENRTPEQLQAGKLNLASELLDRNKLEEMRLSFQEGPHKPPILVDPANLEERQRLSAQRAEIMDDQQHKILIEHFDKVAEHMDANDETATRERLHLLLSILGPVKERIERHNKDCEALAEKVSTSIRKKLDFPESLGETVSDAIMRGAPDAAPHGSDQSLAKEGEELKMEWKEIMRATAEGLKRDGVEIDSSDILAKWQKYKDSVSAYEEKCIESGRASFLKAIGMPSDISPDEFKSFEQDMLAPLPVLKNNGKKDTPSEKLRRAAVKLESQRAEFVAKLPLVYRHGIPEGQQSQWTQKLTSYMLLRSGYEKEVTGDNRNTEKWMLYMGVVGMEIAEEGLENIMKVNGESYALQKVPMLRDMDAAMRARVLKAWEGIGGKLAGKGVPMQKLGEVLGTMNKMGLGPKIWTKLMEVESPATILLWGLYMHTSENKIKAAMQFGSFIAISNASAAMLGFVDAQLIKMGIVSKIPGHPAVKFGVALALAFMSQEQVAAFSTWVDESIPDGPAKHAAGVTLGLVSGETIFAMAGAVSETTGMSGVFDSMGISGFDPDRDMMNYLGEESVTFQDGIPNRHFLHTNLADWNQRLDQFLPSQDNTILRVLQEGLKIDYNAWPKRRAVLLFAQYSGILSTEASLTKLFQERGVLSGEEKIAASAIAVAGEGESRNDRQTAYFIESDPACDKVETFIDTLPQNDPLRKQWKEYVVSVKQMAKDVSIYKNYGIYDKERWLGSGTATGSVLEAKLPQFVESGLIEEIAARVRRKQVILPGSHPELPAGKFGEELSGAVRYRDAMSLPMQLMASIDTAIANAKQNYGRPVTGVEQGDPIADDYMNLKNAINRAINTLLPSELDTALQPVHSLILAGKVASHEELRNAVNVLLNIVITSEQKHVPVKPASGEQLQKLGSKNVPCYIRGMFWQTGDAWVNGERRDDMKWDPFQQAFGGFLDRTQSDLVVIESDTTGNALRSLEFHCNEGDRTKWFIESNAYTTSMAGNFQRGVDRYDSQKTPFTEWQKANPDAALQIEPELVKLQEAGQKNDAYLKREEEKLQQEKSAELSERDRLLLQTKAQPGVWFDYPTRFVDIKKGEVPYQYVSYSAAADNGKGAYLFLQAPSYFDPNVPAVKNNNPADMQVLGRDNATRVGIMREGETEIRREEVTMQSLPSLESGDVRAAWMHDAVLSPIPGKPRDAVAKVLSLCRPVDENYGRQLVDHLASMCPPNDVEAQRQFLFELYRQMPRTDVLYYNEMVRISRVMNAYGWSGIDGALKRQAGNAVMNGVDSFDEKDHYTKQYGWIGNKWLRMKFDGANGWRVGLGSLENATHDPSNYPVSMWGGTDSYNALIGKLAEANGKSLYPAAKQAMAKKGTWVLDQIRGDELGGKIEYVAASDGRVFAQTTDGTRTWIHDFMSGAGIEQHGRYFSGVSGVLKPIPDTNTHHYDQKLHEWMPNAQPGTYPQAQPAVQTAQNG